MTDTDADLLRAAEEVFDGWFARAASIDWNDFLDRLERYADVDMGDSMASPQIERVKAHVRRYRRAG